MKKMIALFLSFIVLLTMMSVNVFAINETYTEGLIFQKTINGNTGEIYYCISSYDGTAEEVIIPDYYNGYPVTEISSNAFSGEEMNYIKLPSQLRKIGPNAFRDCTSLKTITFGSNLTSISSQAFMNCKALEEVYLPENITTIGMSAFYKCESLKKVLGGSGLESISSQAFSGCTSLEGFCVGDKVETIGINAFSSCYNLKSITMGSRIKTIENSAFSYCTSLEKIYFKPGLEIIGSHAFSGCSGLIDIYFPSTVITISGYAFNNCTSIQNIYYAGDEDTYNLIEIDYDHNDALLNANIYYNYICEHSDTTIVPGKNASCIELGFTESEYCNICGEVLIAQSELEMLEHNLYWYHTDSMGENAYDLLCSECEENFGRGYLNNDNQYYMYGYINNGNCFHYIYDVSGVCSGSEKCEIDYWNNDENYHEGVCKCHIIIQEEVLHDYTIEKYNSSGHWFECLQCGIAGGIEEHYYDNDCDTKCNGCDYFRADSIPKHISSDWIIDANATVSAPGSKHKECTVCGETLETVTIAQLKPATPKVATENALNGVLVKWNAVTGATKYQVYRRQGGSNTWTLVGTTTGTSLTDTNVSSGIYYVYSVRAYNNIGLYSDFVSANTQTRKYMAVPKLTGISNATNGLYIKWNPVAGVTNGYRVYRRGAGSTYWTYLGTVKTTYFTDTSVKARSGEYFRYTVIADGGYHSKFDTTGLYLKRLANPALKSAVSSKTGITVKWETVVGTTGYYVYRKTANSGWVRIAAVGGTNNTSYVDKTAKKGVTYTYTVRAVYGATTSYFNSGISCKDKY